MKLVNYVTVITLIGCGNPGETGDISMPVEIISCSHPDSIFEASVYVEVEDDIEWNKVHFEISQGERVWKTRLQTGDNIIWWTKMQLIELDCYSEFNHRIDYEAR